MTRGNKKALTPLIILGVLVLIAALAWIGRDLWLASAREVSCDDGKRRLIDTREFTTQYWTYSVELEASIAKQGKLSAKLSPKQLQQLSDAMQEGREFRHFIVSGYNSCAISKSQYGAYGARFQALDSLARRIDAATNQTGAENLDELVQQYISLSQVLAAER